MARAPSSILIFLRQNPRARQNPNTQIRYHTTETKECDFTEVVQHISLFSALVEAKACNAAKSFLEHTSFSPEPASLESYIQCLCEGGCIQDAIDVFYRLKEAGVCPAIMTWNAALSGCLKDVDVETVGYLIQAFCADNRVSEGYELRQVLVNGLVPENAVFNKLISGFCEEKQYTRVSELLHTMIAKNRVPDNYTYQEVINWLCKKGKGLEGLRVFNDLKDRGYASDIAMYTTMIHGLCTIGWLGEARKLWFEMIEKGYHSNEYTYNTMIHGFCKIGNFEKAKILYKEMCNKGHKETTVSYKSIKLATAIQIKLCSVL
ncbi:hypothetical protein L3X38_017212 [Prunus dulcis]|uniref:Tetratricopeptide repeat-like superfamily protein n=1 Tax=Prunus dulcis TaxID=3755 RepID=A0AAD4Z9U3_PRUDU|nr:hypothetical protein L3X38_017212 [Prunus dulcis]